jgi:hypothetical protein
MSNNIGISGFSSLSAGLAANQDKAALLKM